MDSRDVSFLEASLFVLCHCAVFANGATSTDGAAGFAAGLAERDEVRVPRLPVLDWKYLPESHFGFKGSFCVYQAESVCDAVHMHVHANGRKVEAYGNG